MCRHVIDLPYIACDLLHAIDGVYIIIETEFIVVGGSGARETTNRRPPRRLSPIQPKNAVVERGGGAHTSCLCCVALSLCLGNSY